MHNITQHAPIMLALLAHAHTSSGRLAACLAGTSATPISSPGMGHGSLALLTSPWYAVAAHVPRYTSTAFVSKKPR